MWQLLNCQNISVFVNKFKFLSILSHLHHSNRTAPIRKVVPTTVVPIFFCVFVSLLFSNFSFAMLWIHKRERNIPPHPVATKIPKLNLTFYWFVFFLIRLLRSTTLFRAKTLYFQIHVRVVSFLLTKSSGAAPDLLLPSGFILHNN